MNERLLSIKQVSEMITLKRSSIYRLLAEGAFPRPVKISEKRVAWAESEIDAWIRKNMAKRGEHAK